ncbi:MAG: PDC sensor domain-containing protein [Alphaproteobacteria bacterium]|nr:PDC sensor domain-containing protein [Alphaproteobacteria bacterium]
MRVSHVTCAVVLFLAASVAPAAANDFKPQLSKYIENATWIQDSVVTSAVEAQNEKHAGLSDADIEALDQKWRAEKDAGSGPMISEVLANDLSAWLKQKKDESNGLIAEVFVMDNKGLNVGQSDPTSDYWQGDEAKFQQTFGVGPDGQLIDEVEFDDSSESFISQVSRTITDASGAPIGAVTIGINVELLGG